MAKLTAAGRKRVSASNTALPAKRTKKGGAVSGSYPIPDAAHARAALSLVSQHGTPAEKKAVRAKVHAKYPNMGKAAAKKGKSK